MHLYVGNSAQFVDDAVQNGIAEKLSNAFSDQTGHRPPDSEQRAWRDSLRAKLRVMVKRVLRKHNYPPDKREKATHTVLEQAEVLCHDWVS